MSNEITRFNHVTDWGIERDADGDYVLHSDHGAEVARLRAEIEASDENLAYAMDQLAMADREYLALRAEVDALRAELQNAAKAALDATALACEKEREAEALRVDAERRLALIRSTLENSEWRHGSRNIHAELSREVNAAVGEGK